MIRTRATGSAEQTPTPPDRAAKGRGRGRGRGGECVAARALVRTTIQEPPVAPVGGQVPEAPVVIPGLHETLA